MTGRVSQQAWTWFWSLSINEQNALLDKHFPHRDHECVIQNRTNIEELYNTQGAQDAE